MNEGWQQIVAIIDAATTIADPTEVECESTAESAETTPRAAAEAPAPVKSKEKSVKASKAGVGKAALKDGNVVSFPGRTRNGKRVSKKGAKAAPAGDGDAPQAEPRTFGYSVDDLNSEYALVLMGSKAVVFLEQPFAPIEDQKRMLSLEAFNAWFANRFTERRASDGSIRTVTWAKAWLQSSERRQYQGVEFSPPDNNGDPITTRGYLNLWSGFKFTPAEKPDSKRYKTFRDHLFNNVAGGDEALFRWVFGFFAHLVQRPRERLGVALVLRGRMGTGKTKVGEIIGALFPAHYFLVDDPRYVTGQFNAHMATCLLLQADEAVWAGDKAAEGRLKGLITSPIQQIEAKGIDPIRLPNYVRLVMTSNEDWVVPAGKDERRFAVLDVDPRCAQNHDYFAEMENELDAGGYEHLLGDLMRFALDSVDLRKVPRTEALLEQKIRSLSSAESWWYGRLREGAVTHGLGEWRTEVPRADLFNDYITTSEKIGVRRKQEEVVFGKTLSRLVPSLGESRPQLTIEDDGGRLKQQRVWCYKLPDLLTCRADFERAVHQDIDWPIADGLPAADSTEAENDVVPL